MDIPLRRVIKQEAQRGEVYFYGPKGQQQGPLHVTAQQALNLSATHSKGEITLPAWFQVGVKGFIGVGTVHPTFEVVDGPQAGVKLNDPQPGDMWQEQNDEGSDAWVLKFPETVYKKYTQVMLDPRRVTVSGTGKDITIAKQTGKEDRLPGFDIENGTLKDVRLR